MKQLVHVVGVEFASPPLLPLPLPPAPPLPPLLPPLPVPAEAVLPPPPGLAGRDGAAELKPDGGGELGLECTGACTCSCPTRCVVSGVELVRGIFKLRAGGARVRDSTATLDELLARPRLTPPPTLPLPMPASPAVGLLGAPPLVHSSGDDTVSVPPIVTCFRKSGGPAGYRDAMARRGPDRLESHRTTDDGSLGLSPKVIRSAGRTGCSAGVDTAAESSSSLSESPPKVNMVSWRPASVPPGEGVPMYSDCETCEGLTCWCSAVMFE